MVENKNRSFIFLKNLKGLMYNNYLGETSWKHRKIFEKGNPIQFKRLLAPSLQYKKKYPQAYERKGGWEGREARVLVLFPRIPLSRRQDPRV